MEYWLVLVQVDSIINSSGGVMHQVQVASGQLTMQAAHNITVLRLSGLYDVRYI